MAEIAPALPVVAAAPSAPVTGPAGVAAPAPVAPGQDFVNQLVAALKTLKTLTGVGTPLAAALQMGPVVADETTPEPAAPAKDTATDAPQADAPAQPTNDVLELLASLGVVPAPQAQQVASAPATSAPSTAVPALAVAPQPLTAKAAPTQTESPAPVEGSTAPSPEDTATPAASDHKPAPMSSSTSTSASTSPSTPPTPSSNSTSTATSTSTSSPAAATPAPTNTAAAPAPVPQQSAPAPHAPVVHAVHAQTTFGQDADTGADSGDERGSSEQHSSAKSAPMAATPSTTDVAPAPEHVFSVAAPTTAPASAAQPPANVHPSQVVNQIAQQVDLYRLPGARGVRIQLHPEDLGGVQVTLRYASGGNLELHISVEHAATGALVEAGMPQLRDALATQGFHPDRLVMSVTAPAAATSGQMDFSSNSNNGSYRSDTSGMAAFTQNGQSGQQRDNESRGEAPGFRGWTSNTDTAPVTEDTPRIATSNSRIDYRV